MIIKNKKETEFVVIKNLKLDINGNMRKSITFYYLKDNKKIKVKTTTTNECLDNLSYEEIFKIFG